MKEFMVKELLDRYEKSIQEATYYKARVNRHEDDLRKANREAQQLRVNIHLLEAKIEELQKDEQ
jgi:multidrug resistance efflux pump